MELICISGPESETIFPAGMHFPDELVEEAKEAEYTDWLGNPLEVGTPVLYAISNSHYASMVWGTILEIIPVEGKDYFRKRNFKLKIRPKFQSGPNGLESRGTKFHVQWSEGSFHDPNQKDPTIVRSWYQEEETKPVFIQNVEKVTYYPLTEQQIIILERRVLGKVLESNERIERRREEINAKELFSNSADTQSPNLL